MTLDDLLAAKTGGPPRFFSRLLIPVAARNARWDPRAPRRSRAWCTSRVWTAPVSRRPRSSSAFRRISELSCLNVPVGDRSGFDELVRIVCEYLETTKHTFKDTSVTLLGESMGGLIAPASRKTTGSRRRARAVNPASSFDRSPWPAVGPAPPLLPETLYEGLPYALAPPSTRRGCSKAPSAPPPPPRAGPRRRRGADALVTPAGLAAAAEERGLFPALGQLSAIIPRGSLAHRLGVLAEGARP